MSWTDMKSGDIWADRLGYAGLHCGRSSGPDALASLSASMLDLLPVWHPR